jgi:hypothetical protein
MLMNSHPNPCDANVKILLKNAEYETQQRRRGNFVDQGAGNLIDATEQIASIAGIFS